MTSFPEFGDLTGADNELLDRFVALVDQGPDYEPMWWMNYGALAAVNVACPGPRGQTAADRAQFISGLRERVEALIDAGAAVPASTW